MDATFVTSVYVIFDEIVKAVLEPVKYKPKMVPAEVLLVAVVAARYFHNNLERALILMQQTGYLPASRRLSISRYNRQLHRYANLLEFCLDTLMDLARDSEVYIIDSMPAPVCKRKRAWRCRKARGFKLKIEQGKISAEQWTPDDSDNAMFPPDTFLQLLFGRRSLSELALHVSRLHLAG
jgi:hypothetical protein